MPPQTEWTAQPSSVPAGFFNAVLRVSNSQSSFCLPLNHGCCCSSGANVPSKKQSGSPGRRLAVRRVKLKQDLKAMSRNLKLQIQHKRRIMRAANVMDDEDLQWLLKERERAKSNRDAQERSERTEAGEEVLMQRRQVHEKDSWEWPC